MIIKEIVFTRMAELSGETAVIFVKPLIGKTFRVFRLHQFYKTTGQYDEIVDILTKTCSYYHKGIWYYYPNNTDVIHVVMIHFTDNMNIVSTIAEEQQVFDRDETNKPIQEILN